MNLNEARDLLPDLANDPDPKVQALAVIVTMLLAERDEMLQGLQQQA